MSLYFIALSSLLLRRISGEANVIYSDCMRSELLSTNRNFLETCAVWWKGMLSASLIKTLQHPVPLVISVHHSTSSAKSCFPWIICLTECLTELDMLWRIAGRNADLELVKL